MATVPPKPPIGATGPDPRTHICEMPGCTITANFGHHEMKGERMIEHWRCRAHRWPDWPGSTQRT